jgi:mannose/fructose-specific phosphotransferase system component IIA
MSDGPKALGIVVAHGAMAEGLVDAVRRIAGQEAAGLVPVSNEAKSAKDLAVEIDRLAGGEPALVFVDLQSGSCGMAALTSCRDSARRAVLCGVNLPMLLDFVFNRSEPLEELVPRLVDKGREAIRPASSRS